MNTRFLRPTRPTHIVNFAKVLPLFKSTAEVSLWPGEAASMTVNLTKTGPLQSAQLQLSRPASKTRVQALEAQLLSVPRASGFMSRAAGIADVQTVGVTELQLPFGMPRFVNVATLKRMLKAEREEIMLKRVGDGWIVCDNSLRVDLLDDSVEFRLGNIQVLS